MRFYKKLYMSPSIEKKRRQIMWKLRTGRPQPTLYIIALAKNNDLFEIYHSAMLKQKYYKHKENSPYIIGVANSYNSAVEIVTNIIQEIISCSDGLNVKKYFEYDI